MRDFEKFVKGLGMDASEVDLFLGDVSDFFPHVDVHLLSKVVAEAIESIIRSDGSRRYF